MKVRKGGIYTTIDSKDFGIYQKAGYVKVVDNTSPKFEKVLPETKAEFKKEEKKEEIVEPKAKKKKA